MNTASDTAPVDVCGECGGALVSGTCPACAFMLLLDGGLERWPEAAGSPGGASHMEFGRYTLIRKLATGGMGVVYVAEDRMLKRTVALKMIRGMFFAGAGDVARFKVEAEAAAGLDHPNIVPIYEVGEFEGQPFFTMKWIGGESLAHRLQRAGQRLPAREVAVLWRPSPGRCIMRTSAECCTGI